MSADTAVFGQIVSADAVEEAVRETLELWLPTYIASVERQQGKPEAFYGSIQSFLAAGQLNHYSEHHMPLCVVVCPGLGERPTVDGDGVVSGAFALAVGIVASADDHDNTDAAAKAWGAAVRACLLQKADLGGIADRVTFQDEQYDELPWEESRSFVGGRITFTVHVDELAHTTMSETAGLLEVPDDPYEEPDAPTTYTSAVITTTPTEEIE